MSPPAAVSSHHHDHGGILRSCSSMSKKQVKLLQVQTSMDSSSSTINPSLSASFSSYVDATDHDAYSLPLVGQNWVRNSHHPATTLKKLQFNPLSAVASMFRSFIPAALHSLFIPTCHAWLPLSPSVNNTIHRRKRLLTGTFFGQKKGRVSFAIQETPRSHPILLLELASPTCLLVKEMASGMVRILLECDRRKLNSANSAKANTKQPAAAAAAAAALWDEPVWSMYCNGHKLGYATSRECTPSDFHVLSTVQTVSAGAGVMPATPPTPLMLPPAKPKGSPTSQINSNTNTDSGAAGGGGHPADEIMYMRAKFDRVIGNRDSEALYMINPDCTRNRNGGAKFNNGGPELSIFLLRI